MLEWVAFPFPGDLPHPGIEARSPALQADSLELKIQTVSAQGTTEPVGPPEGTV